MTKSESKQSIEYDEILDELHNYQPLNDPFGYELCDIMRKWQERAYTSVHQKMSPESPQV